MGNKTKERKRSDDADAGRTEREDAASTKAVLKLQLTVRRASESVKGASKAWSEYRATAVIEVGRVMAAADKMRAKLKKLQAKRAAAAFAAKAGTEPKSGAAEKLREKLDKQKAKQAEATPKAKVEPAAKPAAQAGADDAGLRNKAADASGAAPEPNEEAAPVQSAAPDYQAATSALEMFQKAAQEATQSLAQLNQKVQQSAQAESANAEAAKQAAAGVKAQVQAVRAGAQAELARMKAANAASASMRGQSRSARESSHASDEVGASSKKSGTGLMGLSKTAEIAKSGAQSLITGLKKLVKALWEAAQTDSAFSTSLGQIKGNLAIAFQSVYQAALPALRALASVIASVTNAVAQFMSRLFGVSWGAAASGAKKYAKSVGGAGSAAKKAAQNMMSIDELNVMQSEDGGGGGGGGGGGVASIFGDPLQFGAGWQEVFDSAMFAADEMRGLFDQLKLSFQSAWESKGPELMATIQAVLGNIFLIIGNISAAWKRAFQKNDSGERIFAGLLGTLTELFGILQDISDVIVDWAKTADLSPVTDGFAYVCEAVERLAGSIRDALKPIWEALFGPIMDASVQVLGGVFDTIGILIDVISILVSGLGMLVQGVISAIQLVKSILSGGSIKDSWDTFKTDFMSGFDANWANIKEAASGIGKTIQDSASEGLAAGTAQAQTSAEEVSDAINEKLALKAAQAKDIGTQYPENLAAGIDEASAAAQTAVVNSAGSITSALADTPTTEAAKQLGADLMSAFSASITENLPLVSDAMGKFSATIAENLGTLVSDSLEAGREDMRKSAAQYGTDFGDSFMEALAETSTADTAAQLGLDWMSAFSASITENLPLVSEALGGFSETIAEDLGTLVSDSLEAGREDMRKTAALYGTDFGTYFVDAVEGAILTFTSGVATAAETLMSDAKTALTAGASSIGSAFDTAKTTVQSAVNEINEAIASIPRSISVFISLKFGGLANGGLIQMALGGTIHAAAGGGGFSTGQLFVAREAGPELVAGIGGGRTAVMNNDQIVDSVSSGVYKAVVEAMNTAQSGDGGDFVVNVDGRELLRATRRAERASGYRLSGNPSFAR